MAEAASSSDVLDEPLVLYESSTRTVSVPAAINRRLRPYQREGVRFLFEKCFAVAEGASSQTSRNERGAILGDDMGLGKTVQAVALMAAMLGKKCDGDEDKTASARKRYGDSDPGSEASMTFLLVVPGSVIANWERELNDWAHFVFERFVSLVCLHLIRIQLSSSTCRYHRENKLTALRLARQGRLDVVITTFDTVREEVDDLNLVDWDAVIVDEVRREEFL
jgi:SNF2 family DNA or RNA helicase